MLYDVRIKLKSHILGDQLDEKGIRRFVRDGQADYLVLDASMWFWLWRTVADSLDGFQNIDLETIMVPQKTSLATINLFVRRYHTSNGTPKRAMHEAINSGALVNFQMLVSALRPGLQSDSKRLPDVVHLRTGMMFIGEYMGINPFGVTRGYGRFTLERLELHERK